MLATINKHHKLFLLVKVFLTFYCSHNVSRQIFTSHYVCNTPLLFVSLLIKIAKICEIKVSLKFDVIIRYAQLHVRSRGWAGGCGHFNFINLDFQHFNDVKAC